MMSTCFRCGLLVLLLYSLMCGSASARTVEFETTEVTAADVTVSPDGQWLIFTMVGHLFRLPVTGGTAEQLTFGPYYDTDPIFSPAGTSVAFVSDRDGSEGNVFVLELATGKTKQVTHEPWVGRPTWTPDGQGIIYLGYVREAARGIREVAGWAPLPAVVKRVACDGGDTETLSPSPRLFRSIFHLPDGRLAWTVVEREAGLTRWTTRFEVLNPQGTEATLRTVDGYIDRAVANHSGEGFYCRHFRLFHTWFPARATEHLIFLPESEQPEMAIMPLSASFWGASFALSANGENLFLNHSGRLWRVTLPSGARSPIPFLANVVMEVQDRAPLPRLEFEVAESPMSPRSLSDPAISPDGRRVVFSAAGFLWQQVGNEANAQRLSTDNAVEKQPAFSPDGQFVAYVRSQHGKNQLRVFDLKTRQVRVVASGSSFANPSWSHDGQRLLFIEYGDGLPRVNEINLLDGSEKTIIHAAGWTRSPQFTDRGKAVYFNSNMDGKRTVYRQSLDEGAKPEPVTDLEGPLIDGLVSPDDKWLIFRRGMGLWIAPIGAEPVEEHEVRSFSPEAVGRFSFTSDGSAVIYTSGNRLWRQPLKGGEPVQIHVRLELKRAITPPLLLREVRVLDLASGGFLSENSIYVEQGRIRWIGSEQGRSISPGAIRVNCGGRFAIPGLFDFHAHAELANQQAFLAYGVTSVRDPGSSLARMNALADRGETTNDAIPRYFFSGDMFQGAQVSGSVQIRNEKEARAFVRMWNQRGAQFIKVYPSLSWPLQRVVAEEALLQGLPVVGHGTDIREITKSVLLGYAVVEHSNWSGRVYNDVLRMLAATGTRWDPTLAMYAGSVLLLRDEPERLEDPKLKAFTPEWCTDAVWTYGFMKTVGDKALRGDWIEQLAGIRAARQNGVLLQAGTDVNGASWLCVPGASLHWELEFFVQAGLSPLEVIRIATQEAATAVGAEDDLGTLDPGKLADIVLLDRNPLDDIKNTQTIWRVIKGGWLFDPEKLRPPESVKMTE